MSNFSEPKPKRNNIDYAAKEAIIDVGKDSKRIMPKWQRNLIFGILILTSLCGLTAYFMRINLFKELIKPTIPFQIAEQPPKPNYEDSSAWAQRPQDNKAFKDGIAVFFIHPTSYYNGKMGWNADISEAKSLERLEKIIIPNHAIPYKAAGELWIPKYRQATLFSSLSLGEDAKEALNLAYSDIETAFDNFIKARGENSPFILVGIGQGGLHGLRLIQTKIANSELEKSLVAAYLIDQAVSEHELPSDTPATNSKFGNIEFCTTKDQTNCIISFNQFDKTDERLQEIFKERALTWSIKHGYSGLGGRGALCTNPINGTAYSNATANLNTGSAAANSLEDGTEPALLPAETGAYCIGKTGILAVDNKRPQSLKPSRFELGAKFKTQAYNLFYKPLETDALNRAKAFRETAKRKEN